MTINPPHFSIHTAPTGAEFTHFEAQTVVELDDFSDGSTWTPYGQDNTPNEDDGDVLSTQVAVYGKLPDGTTEHIADREDEEAALDLIRKLGGTPI